MSELAIHGGAPVRTEPYPTWPTHDDCERANLLEVLDSNRWWSSQGTKVREFERRWGAFHGTGRAVAVTNGSHAIDVALLATDLGAVDRGAIPDAVGHAIANHHVTLPTLESGHRWVRGRLPCDRHSRDPRMRRVGLPRTAAFERDRERDADLIAA